MHIGHHRDPHSVFTAGAWAPVAIVSLLIFGIAGLTPASAMWLGLVAGFLSYELFHYRIHFARPLCAFEEKMRTRHLAHHMRAPGQIFGVTNRIWDCVFGSEPDDAHLRGDARLGGDDPAVDRTHQLPSRLPPVDLPEALVLPSEGLDISFKQICASALVQPAQMPYSDLEALPPTAGLPIEPNQKYQGRASMA